MWVLLLQFPSSIHLYRCIAKGFSSGGFCSAIRFVFFCGGSCGRLTACLNGIFRLLVRVFFFRTSLLFGFPLPCIGL